MKSKREKLQCPECGKVCMSAIGLWQHQKKHPAKNQRTKGRPRKARLPNGITIAGVISWLPGEITRVQARVGEIEKAYAEAQATLKELESIALAFQGTKGEPTPPEATSGKVA
jgi:hypothetical protein